MKQADGKLIRVYIPEGKLYKEHLNYTANSNDAIKFNKKFREHRINKHIGYLNNAIQEFINATETNNEIVMNSANGSIERNKKELIKLGINSDEIINYIKDMLNN